MSRLLLIAGLILASCSGLQQSEHDALRRNNAVEGKLASLEAKDYAIATPIKAAGPVYPWEAESGGKLPRITREYFRCKGSALNPQLPGAEAGELCCDCEGGQKHGLPMIRGKEGVYPVLLDLLNYIQRKTQKKVIITCGHRCPKHNAYADSSAKNRTSKHMMGAEVDFYVKGLEEKPLQIVELLCRYYREHPSYKNKREYSLFARYEKDDAGVVIFPWYNKEIFIKICQKDEGRDFENRHPYPYISIQVRYDRDAEERVNYTWEKAHRNFLRF